MINDIEKALENKLYFIALQCVLTLPDICNKLSHETNIKSGIGERYKSWYSENVKTRANLSAEQVWNFRCRMSHEAISSTSSVKKSSSTLKEKICFLYPTKGITLQNNYMFDGDTVIINIDLIDFCEDIISSVRRWQDRVKDTDYYKEHYDDLIQLRQLKGFINVNDIPYIG